MQTMLVTLLELDMRVWSDIDCETCQGYGWTNTRGFRLACTCVRQEVQATLLVSESERLTEQHKATKGG